MDELESLHEVVRGAAELLNMHLQLTQRIAADQAALANVNAEIAAMAGSIDQTAQALATFAQGIASENDATP